MSAALDLPVVLVLLLIPAIAVPVLALVANYRVGATLNVIACAFTFAASLGLLIVPRVRSELLIVDDFNVFFVVLTTFVGFTTSVFSATRLLRLMTLSASAQNHRGPTTR